MKDTEFKRAYLNILKEGAFDVPADVTDTAETEKDNGSESTNLKKVCFVTSDNVLIDALNSGFEEVVIFTNAKDEATGEDTVVEVKFGKDSFGEVEITDADAEAEDNITDECGDVTGEDADGVEEDVETEDADGIEEDVETEDADGIEEDVETEDADGIEEDVDPSEWIEDGVCVKCGSSECKGDCKCEKCGDVNCIGDCEVQNEDLLGAVGGGLAGGAIGGPLGAVGGAILGSKI